MDHTTLSMTSSFNMLHCARHCASCDVKSTGVSHGMAHQSRCPVSSPVPLSLQRLTAWAAVVPTCCVSVPSCACGFAGDCHCCQLLVVPVTAGPKNRCFRQQMNQDKVPDSCAYLAMPDSAKQRMCSLTGPNQNPDDDAVCPHFITGEASEGDGSQPDIWCIHSTNLRLIRQCTMVK
jgi:hypothetical protein